MVTTIIEYSPDGGSSWNGIDYRDYEIRNGTGRNLLAPMAKVWTNSLVDISRDDLLRIKIGGTRRFEGYSKSDGQVDTGGILTIEARGYGYEIMNEVISLNLSNVSPETVLENTLDESSNADYDSTNLNTTSATNITLDSFDVDQKMSQIFQDMMSRAGYIIRIFPDKTINFEPYKEEGDMGEIMDFQVKEYTPNDKSTVINKVTVYGTYEGNVYNGVAEDYTYVGSGEKRERVYNVKYVYSDAEAENLAEKRLRPEPEDTGTLTVFGSDFTSSNKANYTLDFYSEEHGLGSSGNKITVVVEEQKIRENYMELKVGGGASYGQFQSGLKTYSDDDKTGPGKQWSDIYDDGHMPVDDATENQIYWQSTTPSGTDGDIWVNTSNMSIYTNDAGSWTQSTWESVDEDRLENLSVSAPKIQDLAISNAKIQEDAVNTPELVDLAIEETKIDNESISTPKVQADAIDTNEIHTNAVKANEVDADAIDTIHITADAVEAGQILAGEIGTGHLDAGAVTADKIRSSTITANEIDVLDLDTAQFTVGDQGSNSVFVFGYSSGSDEVFMYPDNAGGLLGLDPYPFYRLYIESLRPHTYGPAGSCGDSTYYWDSVYADTYYGKTTSIQSFTPPDYEEYTLDKLMDWRFDNHELPDFVIMPTIIEKRAKKENISEKKAKEKLLDDLNDNSIENKIETIEDLPEDSFPIDKNPVGIDRMIPVLLRVCQDQQEVIDSLEKRIEKLEKHK